MQHPTHTKNPYEKWWYCKKCIKWNVHGKFMQWIGIYTYTREILYQPISGGKTAFRLSFVCTPRRQFYFIFNKILPSKEYIFIVPMKMKHKAWIKYRFAVITDNSVSVAFIQIHYFRPSHAGNVSKYVKISLLCKHSRWKMLESSITPCPFHISHQV